MFGTHKHRCVCGAIWEHGDVCAELDEETFDKSHTCPKCGKENVVDKYWGSRQVNAKGIQCEVPKGGYSDAENNGYRHPKYDWLQYLGDGCGGAMQI